MRLILCLLVAVSTVSAQQPAKRKPAASKKPAAAAKTRATVTPAISPASLRAHVSFLAADAMQGRSTPSHELDIAAEYIAAQFRRIGLEQPSPTGYFQISERQFSVDTASGTISIAPHEVSLPTAATIAGALTKLASAEGLTPERTRNRIIITRPEVARQIYAQREKLNPLFVVAVAAPDDSDAEGVATVRSSKLRELYESLPEGRTDARLTVIAPGLKNVIGVLPGGDPALRSQYVILSAHYDHVGARTGEGDGIFNGANDNASGVAGVIEAAAALMASPAKPRRTVVFIAFFGEESGLIGARYYAAHPVFPIESTVANLNLEQLGRTDDSEGPRVSAAVLTGFGFSELAGILGPAMLSTGVKLEEHVKLGDRFFQLSDNFELAKVGVPAHTLGVSFMFPDYHKPGDEWQKLDYDNMAKITRAITAGVLAISNRADPPRWLTKNPSAEPYANRATPLSKPREASVPESGNSPASPKRRRPRR